MRRQMPYFPLIGLGWLWLNRDSSYQMMIFSCCDYFESIRSYLRFVIVACCSLLQSVFYDETTLLRKLLVYSTNGDAGEAHTVHLSSNYDGHFFARSFELFRGTWWWHDGLKGGVGGCLLFPDILSHCLWATSRVRGREF